MAHACIRVLARGSVFFVWGYSLLMRVIVTLYVVQFFVMSLDLSCETICICVGREFVHENTNVRTQVFACWIERTCTLE